MSSGSTFFSRFITMKVKDNPLKRIAPTIREKCLQGILGKDAKIECTTHNEFYLLQVSSKTEADLLLKTNKFHITPTHTIDIEFAPHNQLNETKGVLFDRMNELEDMTTDEITESLSDYGVTRTDRLPTRAKNPNDRRKPGTTYFLTFLAEAHPGSVKIGYDYFRITDYQPRPRLCQNCLMYGHGTRKCRGKAKCGYCQGEHTMEECPTKDTPAPCYHCGSNDHLAGNKECSKYKYETEVVTVMQRDHLLHYQARSKVNSYWNSTENGAQSYAKIVVSKQTPEQVLPGSSKGETGPAPSHSYDASIQLKHENQKLKTELAHVSQEMANTVKRLNEVIEKLAAKENELMEERESRIDLQNRISQLEKWASAKNPTDPDQTPLMKPVAPVKPPKTAQTISKNNNTQNKPPSQQVKRTSENKSDNKGLPPPSRRLSDSKNDSKGPAPAAPTAPKGRTFPGFIPGAAQAKRQVPTKSNLKEKEVPTEKANNSKRPAASPAGTADQQESKKIKSKGDGKEVINLEATLRKESSSSTESVDTLIGMDTATTPELRRHQKECETLPSRNESVLQVEQDEEKGISLEPEDYSAESYESDADDAEDNDDHNEAFYENHEGVEEEAIALSSEPILTTEKALIQFCGYTLHFDLDIASTPPCETCNAVIKDHCLDIKTKRAFCESHFVCIGEGQPAVLRCKSNSEYVPNHDVVGYPRDGPGSKPWPRCPLHGWTKK